MQTVLGLNTVSKAVPLLVRPHTAVTRALAPRDRAHVVTGGPQPCAAATAADSQGGYTDDQIASAYGLSGLYTSGGAGGTPDLGANQTAKQTVAILELEPYTPSDIQSYEVCYGRAPAYRRTCRSTGAPAAPNPVRRRSTSRT